MGDGGGSNDQSSAGGGPFQIGDDFVALRVSMQVDDAGVTGLHSLVQEVDPPPPWWNNEAAEHGCLDYLGR
jgi:hypothetical protein